MPLASPRVLTSAQRARAEQLDREAHDDRRMARRNLARAAAVFGGSLALGLGLLALGVGVDDPGWGAIAFWGGLVVGNGGMLLTLFVLWRDSDA